MPRPKKKKVVLLEEEPEELLMSKDDDTAKDEVPSPTDVTKLEPEPQAVPDGRLARGSGWRRRTTTNLRARRLPLRPLFLPSRSRSSCALSASTRRR